MNEIQAQHKLSHIPAGLDFSRVLAGELLRETRGQPEALTRYRILLPTRRACRVLRDAFLDLRDGAPILLPQMSPVGDVEEEDLSLMMLGGRSDILDIPPAMSPLRRQVLLARMIRAMPDFAAGPDHALALAQALGQLLDKVATEELDLADLRRIVPEEFAAHWGVTLSFLEIISAHWPEILAEEGMIDGAQRRNLLLRGLARHWEVCRPDTPVIAAGSTGSLPATARLFKVIHDLPQGRLVLPGLDKGMDGESWDALGESHPQYGLKLLLGALDARREDVVDLDGGEDVPVRTALASEVMRPAETTHCWKNFAQDGRRDLARMVRGLRFYECRTQQDEAQIIALHVREMLQKPGASIALISPDRGLAQRVVALCRRWGVEADDSAGQSLAHSRIGTFMMLALEAAVKPVDWAGVMAFLKHVLCHAGMENKTYRKCLYTIEKEILRGREAVFTLAQLHAAAGVRGREELNDFGACVCSAFEGMARFQDDGGRFDFAQILRAHLAMLETFAADEVCSGEDLLWRGEDGEAAAMVLAELQQHSDLIGKVSFAEYKAILAQVLGQVSVRSPYGVHPRLAILGQLEARLTSADLIIMAGLSEGTWPAGAGHDPWMSRMMRKDFGLPSDERGVGLAAHDFVQAFCAGNVVMTRAQQVDGAPCVRSRWLSRLDTVMKACGGALDDLGNGPAWGWMEALDRVAEVRAFERPKPRPPVSARPNRVSVTKIENWLQDPYTIYAYYVLELRRLNPLKRALDAAGRGTLLHGILERFLLRCPVEIPEDAEVVLADCARAEMEAQGIAQEDVYFWWPRFERIAQWYIAHERSWRARAKFMASEVKGGMDMEIAGRRFTIHGVADRVDRGQGGYALIDYKSGGTFSKTALRDGKLPQLPLEALIMRGSGFDGGDEPGKRVQAGAVSYLGYWKMTGGRMAGEEIALDGDLEETLRIVEEGLRCLVDAFYQEETPFYCVPDMGNAPRFNDYEHLARLKEWAVLDNEDGEDAA